LQLSFFAELGPNRCQSPPSFLFKWWSATVTTLDYYTRNGANGKEGWIEGYRPKVSMTHGKASKTNGF